MRNVRVGTGLYFSIYASVMYAYEYANKHILAVDFTEIPK
jgi:hypothetical protein